MNAARILGTPSRQPSIDGSIRPSAHRGGLTTLAETLNPWGTGLFDLHTAPFDFHRAAEAVAETKAAHPYRIESRARLPDAEPGRANATSDVSMNQTLNITV